MNRWEDTVLTDKGAAFHSKLANGQTLKITRVMTGAAKVPVVNLRQQTGVTDEGKQRFEESYEFFSIISSRLWKGLLPTMEDRKSTRLNSSHGYRSRMPSSA